MLQKFLATFAVLALVVASAGAIPAPGSSFKLILVQPSVVKGTELKAGDYRVNLERYNRFVGNDPNSLVTLR